MDEIVQIEKFVVQYFMYLGFWIDLIPFNTYPEAKSQFEQLKRDEPDKAFRITHTTWEVIENTGQEDFEPEPKEV